MHAVENELTTGLRSPKGGIMEVGRAEEILRLELADCHCPVCLG